MDENKGHKFQAPQRNYARPAPQEEYAQERPSLLRTLFLSTAALAVLASFMWWSSAANIFRYRETPAIEQESIGSVLEAETIILPVNVIVFRNDGDLGSKRDEENIQRLIINVSRIFAQADIALSLVSIHEVVKNDDELDAFLNDPSALIRETVQVQPRPFDPRGINLFLIRKLHGINGIAFGGLQSAAVADVTTVQDFRALAHEIGHLLGLSHTNDSLERLMYRGANGTRLTEGEILKAREGAQRFMEIRSQ